MDLFSCVEHAKDVLNLILDYVDVLFCAGLSEV